MRTPNNNVSYLLSDHLGSTSLTVDSAGYVTSEMRYTPWGDTRFTSGTNPTNYRFTGQRQEASFGLYFYNARWYDPAIGRFAQADTIVPGGVQGLDRYAYTKNNPVRYTDPSGHKPCWAHKIEAYSCNLTEQDIKNIAQKDKEEGTCTLCIVYHLDSGAASQLINDLDNVLFVADMFNLGTGLGEIAAGAKAILMKIGNQSDYSLLAVAAILGVSISEVPMIIGLLAVAVGITVTLPASMATMNLQALRNGLSDADADTLGATIMDEFRIGYHQITISSTKNGGYSTSFTALTVSPIMMFTPVYLWGWTEAKRFSSDWEVK